MPELLVVLVSAGLAADAPKEKAGAAAVTALGADVASAAAGVLPADAPKLKLGVMEGPAGFWAPPKIGTLDEAAVPAEKLGGFDSAGAATVVFAAPAGELEAAGTEAVGFGDPKENIPLPTIGAVLLSVLLVAAVGDPKLKEAFAAGDAKAVELLAVVVAAAPAASEPKLTVGLLCSVVVVLLLLLLFAAFGVVSAGLPKENPTLLGVSAGFLLEDGEPKLNPLVVVEVTASEVFEASVKAGLEPKLNPPDAGFGASALSASLEPSVVSDVAAGLLPKLKPVPAGLGAAAALGVVVPLPKLNLGLSSAALDVLVVDVTDPNVNPVLAEVDVLVDELAGGTPKENPVLGASAVLELGCTPKLNLAPEEDDDDGLLPKEKEGASSGVDPGLAWSQQAHLEREASFRVIHALHSHLLADCCATSALNP